MEMQEKFPGPEREWAIIHLGRHVPFPVINEVLMKVAPHTDVQCSEEHPELQWDKYTIRYPPELRSTVISRVQELAPIVSWYIVHEPLPAWFAPAMVIRGLAPLLFGLTVIGASELTKKK
jgi:hypothetical protein